MSEKRLKPTKEILSPILYNDDGKEIARTRTHIFVEKGKLKNYIHQLEFFDKEKWKVVVRFNYFHSFVHKDIFNRKEEKIETENLGEFAHLVDALEKARNDLKMNVGYYIRKFVRDENE